MSTTTVDVASRNRFKDSGEEGSSTLTPRVMSWLRVACGSTFLSAGGNVERVR